MNPYRLLPSLAAVLLAAGCASPTPAPTATAAAEPTATDSICRQETALGTNIARTRCRTAAEREAEREAAERMAERIRNTPGAGRTSSTGN